MKLSMKTMGRVWLIMALWMTVTVSALASPGGTDANGGHYNHTTGLYHYHHGEPEHQHENGICPVTGEKWELKIPEKPATLAEWNAMKHQKTEVPTIDNETPANEGSEKTEAPVAAAEAPAAAAQTEKPASGAPVAAGGAAAAAVGGAVIYAFRRKKKPAEAAAEPEAEEVFLMPEDTEIGPDGLPWERDALTAYLARRAENPGPEETPTNCHAPKWGPRYTFCTDADGDEIHTMDCELAFIQVNAAAKHCPKADCELCKPVRPDLRWYEKMKAGEKAEDLNKVQTA